MNEKTLPANLDAERATLGSVLMNRDALLVIAPWLHPPMFYAERHAWIYAAMLQCLACGTPPDARMVSDELRRRGQLDQLGGLPYLAELIEAVPTSYHVEHYARIVERCSVLRALIAAGARIAALGYDEQTDLESTIEQAQAVLTRAAHRTNDGAIAPLGQALHEVYNAMMDDEHGPPGCPIGLRDYDEMTGGLHDGNLIIAAGRPGHGKTGLALSIALNLAERDKRVLIFELEMSRDELAQRTIAQRSGVDLSRITRHRLGAEEIDRIVDAMGGLCDLSVDVDETGAASLSDIRTRALRHATMHGRLDLVIVDYIQLVRVNLPGRTREQEVAEVSRGLKALAKELRCPVLALAQLNRGVEHRSDPRPLLADLRDSGQLEQDADQVMFVFREELHDKDTDKKGIAELIIAKHRNGPLGVAPLRFEASTTRFMDLSYRLPDAGPPRSRGWNND